MKRRKGQSTGTSKIMYKTTTLLLVLLAVCCCVVNESLGYTFWVTPNYQTSCQNRTPCDTIDGYYQKNNSIFSTSDVTWFFLEGEHFITKRNIEIKRAQNVKIKGEHYLKSSIHFLYHLVIDYSKNIIIENLKMYFFRDLDYKVIYELHLSISHVHNLTMKNIKWFTSSAANVAFFEITGIINIQETTFSGEFLITFILGVTDRSIESKILSINIQQTEFWNIKGIVIYYHFNFKPLIYDSMEISIDSCWFFGFWPMFFMQINQFGLANVKIVNSTFTYNDYVLSRPTQDIDAIRVEISTTNGLQQARDPLVIMLIDNCTISMPISLTFNYSEVTNFNFFRNKNIPMLARITIQNTEIKHDKSCQYLTYFSARFIPPKWYSWPTINNLYELRKPTLILANCTFNIKKCFTDFDTASLNPKIITIKNFQQFYIYMHNVSVFTGDGIGLILEESIVHMHGTNRIENFAAAGHKSSFIGIKMTFNSRILLDDSSVVLVHAGQSTEGILVDPMGYLWPYIPNSHEDSQVYYYNHYTKLYYLP